MASKCADYKFEQRAYVKIRTLLKMSAKEIHNDLLEVDRRFSTTRGLQKKCFLIGLSG